MVVYKKNTTFVLVHLQDVEDDVHLELLTHNERQEFILKECIELNKLWRLDLVDAVQNEQPLLQVEFGVVVLEVTPKVLPQFRLHDLLGGTKCKEQRKRSDLGEEEAVL